MSQTKDDYDKEEDNEEYKEGEEYEQSDDFPHTKCAECNKRLKKDSKIKTRLWLLDRDSNDTDQSIFCSYICLIKSCMDSAEQEKSEITNINKKRKRRLEQIKTQEKEHKEKLESGIEDEECDHEYELDLLEEEEQAIRKNMKYDSFEGMDEATK